MKRIRFVQLKPQILTKWSPELDGYVGRYKLAFIIVLVDGLFPSM